MKPKKNSVYYKIDALVLKSRPAGNGSLIVTLLDSRLGKLEMVAFGAQREKSSRRSALLVGNWITGDAEETGPDSMELKECHLFRAHPQLTSTLYHSSYLFLLFETFDALLPLRLPGDYFTLLEETLERLETASDGGKYVLSALLTLFSGEGVLPEAVKKPDGTGLLQIGGREITIGAGTARFLADNERQGGHLSFWVDKKLNAQAESGLRQLCGALYCQQTGRWPASLSLFTD